MTNIKKIYLLSYFIIAESCNVFCQHVYSYTGGVQTYTVPACATSITIDARGAQGMINLDNNSLGGLGARVQATMSVTPGEVLEIYVGGGGYMSNPGGWNGGGDGGLSYTSACYNTYPPCVSAEGGGGGGASDVRISPYGYANRMVVAAGGGGTGGDRMFGCGPGTGGGGGGGYYGGGGGGGYSGQPGQGGTQTAGGTAGGSPGCSVYCGLGGTAGALGVGGTGGEAPGNDQAGNNPGCQGGCGGNLTGDAGNDCTGDNCPGTWSGGSGGGGSSYASPLLTLVTVTPCYQSGNGEVIITDCNVLPIELISFTAKCAGNDALLQWQTATETNNRIFTLYRSSDGINFNEIRTVKGAVNSSSTHNYSFTDYNPFPGASYYKISQTDLDGTTTAVKTISFVSCAQSQNVNAFLADNNTIEVQINAAQNDTYTFALINILGQTVFTQTGNIYKGMNDIKLSPHTANGMYILRVSGTNNVSYKKLVFGSN